MRDKKATRIAKISKAAAAPVALAAVATLVLLVTTSLCPNCQSGPADEPAENREAASGVLVANLNADNFSASIEQGVTLVDFWAPWCGPCRIQGPILEQVAQSVRGRAKIAKVNVDEVRSVAGRFGVQSIPTLVLFEDGKEVRRFVGVQSNSTLIGAIDELKKRS